MEQLIEIISDICQQKEEKRKIDEKTYVLAKRHSLSAFLYPVTDENVTEASLIKKIKEDYYQAIKKDMVQMHELKKILQIFEQEKIPCFPLKGSILKNLYPESFYREMGDLDILVERKSFNRAKAIIQKLGYKRKSNAEHHLELIKEPFLLIELHRSLITKKELGSTLFHDLFSGAKCYQDHSFIYEMKEEDFYLFMMCHLLKHMINGGAGLRSFLDIYIFLTHYPDLDFTYIDRQLSQTAYSKEAKRFRDFSLHLFNKQSLSEEEIKLKDFIVSSGTYGTICHMTESDLNRNRNSANQVIFKKIFLNVSSMKEIYSYLNYCILLLPFAYIQRFFSFLFSSHARRRARELKREENRRKKSKDD